MLHTIQSSSVPATTPVNSNPSSTRILFPPGQKDIIPPLPKKRNPAIFSAREGLITGPRGRNWIKASLRSVCGIEKTARRVGTWGREKRPRDDDSLFWLLLSARRVRDFDVPIYFLLCLALPRERDRSGARLFRAKSAAAACQQSGAERCNGFRGGSLAAVGDSESFLGLKYMWGVF